MKKIRLIFFSLLLISITTISCDDDDKKDDFFSNVGEVFEGVFVTIEQETLVIDFTDPSASYDFIISAPSSNVEEYQLQLTHTSEGVVSDTISVGAATNFPASFSFQTSDLANFFNLNPDELVAGDRFDFIGSILGANGEIANLQNLNSDATSPGQLQGFNHTTFLSCPFDVNELEGTYVIEEGGDAGIHIAGDEFEIIAGPEENQYSILNFGDIDLIVNVDPETGISIPSDDVLITFLDDDLELAPLPINSGFTFSCTGAVFLTNIEYSCCEGVFPLIMSKQEIINDQ